MGKRNNKVENVNLKGCKVKGVFVMDKTGLKNFAFIYAMIFAFYKHPIYVETNASKVCTISPHFLDATAAKYPIYDFTLTFYCFFICCMVNWPVSHSFICNILMQKMMDKVERGWLLSHTP